LCHPSQAQTPPQVLVTDSGVQTAIIVRWPAHTIGLQGHRQTIVMDTGTQTYGLRYVIARDPKNRRRPFGRGLHRHASAGRLQLVGGGSSTCS